MKFLVGIFFLVCDFRVRVLEGMKGSLDRTKVVLRHLPPGITEAMLVEQVDSAFAGRYNWLSFRPGRSRLVFLFFCPFLIIFFIRLLAFYYLNFFFLVSGFIGFLLCNYCIFISAVFSTKSQYCKM